MTVGSVSKPYPGSLAFWIKYPNGSYEYQSTHGVGRKSSKSWNGGDAGKRPPHEVPNTAFNAMVLDRTSQNEGSQIESLGLSDIVRTVPSKFGKGSRRRVEHRAPKAYTMQSVIVENPRATSLILYHVNGSKIWESSAWSIGNVFGELLPESPPSFDANDQIKLVGKLRESLRGSDFNMAVFLGEGSKTLEMIGTNAYRLANSFRAFRKGDIERGIRWIFDGTGRKAPRRGTMDDRRTETAVSSNWLQVQYGVIPLLSDMKSGAEALAHRLNVPFRRRYLVRISKNHPNPSPWLNIQVSRAISTRSRQLIAYISEQESLPSLSGMLDPELVAWELVPFSFVADWALPIGDYLQARATASRLSGLYVTTELTRREASGIGSKPYFQKYTFSDPGYRAETVTMTRSVSSTLAVPFPVVKPFSKIASWQHAANGLALLQQVFRSK